MASINLEKIQAQVASIKAAGAPSIDPTGWEKLTTDLQHAVEEFKAAQADGKFTLTELFAVAMDFGTLAGDIAAVAGSLFQAKAAAAS